MKRSAATCGRDASAALPAGAVGEHEAGLLGALWPAEQVAERAATTELGEPGTFGPRLDSLGDDTDTMRMRELDHGRDDAVTFEVRPDTADERLVELDRLDGQLIERS